MFSTLNPFAKLAIVLALAALCAWCLWVVYKKNFTKAEDPNSGGAWNLLIPICSAILFLSPMFVYMLVVDGYTHIYIHGIQRFAVSDPINDLTLSGQELSWTFPEDSQPIWVAINAYRNDTDFETFMQKVDRKNKERTGVWKVPSSKEYKKFKVSYGTVEGPSAPSEVKKP